MTPTRPITLVSEPTIVLLAEMALHPEGVLEMAKWVKRYRPECVPSKGFNSVLDLLPHDGTDGPLICRMCGHVGSTCSCRGGDLLENKRKRTVTDNELLCELAGRKCYDSFAEKAAPRSNADYLASMWTGRDVVHRSTGYHAKMSFFFAHISRRVSHELIRNYVGADRSEEGNPSQESTRFTHHPGIYILHPRDQGDPETVRLESQDNYNRYCGYIDSEIASFKLSHGHEPKGMDRKRIYESAAGRLSMSCGTSFLWTTNPMAMAKFFAERCDEAADLEMSRFATAWKKFSLARWPGLFPMVKS